MKNLRYLLLLLVIIFSLGNAAVARADIAPPYMPPGANPGPGSETTQVSMLAETVLIDVQAKAPANSLGQAKVSADFTMRNTGSNEEKLAVRFPISANDGRFNVNEVKNLQVQVNGKTIPTRRITGPDPYYGYGDDIPWAEFDVKFPPGKEVDIRVSYLMDATGYSPFAAFFYILDTGAGWKGPIGSADLIVRLPYEATPQNVLLTEHTGWSLTTPGATLDGKDVRWHYDNLEPTREHNLEISLVQPSYWQKVLAEQANTTKNPQDGEAWGRLGRAYKAIAFFSKGPREKPDGEKLFELSRQAYERCLSLLPDDALWHSGLAELFLMHYNSTFWDNPEASTDLLRAVEEIHRALEIDPKTPKALELAEELTWTAPDYVTKEGEQFIFLALTATPAPTDVPSTATAATTDIPPTLTQTEIPASPTAAPTTAAPSPTTAPTLQTSPTQPEAQASSPSATAVPPAADGAKTNPKLCGAGLLIPFMLIVPLISLNKAKVRARRRSAQ